MNFRTDIGHGKWSILIGMVLLMITGCSQNQDDVKLPIYDAIGGDFTLPSTLGNELTLSSYRGSVVLLNFGYTHCPAPPYSDFVVIFLDWLNNEYIFSELCQFDTG